MQYRPLGKTGYNVSAVGLGAEHLDNKPYAVVEETILAALDAGINIMDLFMPGDEIRSNIGRALGKRRKDVVIQGHIGSCDLNEQYDRSRDAAVCERYFEALQLHHPVVGGALSLRLVQFLHRLVEIVLHRLVRHVELLGDGPQTLMLYAVVEYLDSPILSRHVVGAVGEVLQSLGHDLSRTNESHFVIYPLTSRQASSSCSCGA